HVQADDRLPAEFRIVLAEHRYAAEDDEDERAEDGAEEHRGVVTEVEGQFHTDQAGVHARSPVRVRKASSRLACSTRRPMGTSRWRLSSEMTASSTSPAPATTS